MHVRQDAPRDVGDPCRSGPAHLDADAKKEFRRLANMLLRIRVLTEADGIALANLCQA